MDICQIDPAVTAATKIGPVTGVAQRFLEIANRHTRLQPLLDDFVVEIKRFTGCQSVGLRILDEIGNIPYGAQDGFSMEFMELENALSVHVHKCVCINVIRGKTDATKPYYTPNGSFYTPSMGGILKNAGKERPTKIEQVHAITRGACPLFGYETMALVPISFAGKTMGLIHLADTRGSMIPPETIAVLENAGKQLGIALSRVQTEESLQQSQQLVKERLEQLVNERTAELTDANRKLVELASFPTVNPNPVMRVSPHGEVMFANEASKPILECWKTRTGGLLQGDWLARIRTIFDSGTTEVIEIECQGRYYDLTVFPSAALGFLNLYAMDISRRKGIARELETSEANYRMLFNNASDAMILWEKQEDGTFRIKEANQVACQRYGYSYEEMLILTGSDLNTPDSYAGARRAADQLMKTGYATYELTHVTKDGRLIPSEVYGHIFEHEGKTVVLAVVRDITERKQAEAEKARYQEQLEGLVSERTRLLTTEIMSRQRAEAELRVLYQREHSLSEKLQKQIDERVFFTRALVHELKTPLTPLLGSSEMLLALAREEPTISLIKNVHNGALKLNKRIEQLLDLAKGEVGILKLKHLPVNIIGLIGDTVTYVTPAAAKKGLTIHTDLPSAIPLARGDREYLSRVTLNLLDNAIKFTDEGGRILARAGLQDNMILVEVSDTGRGISAGRQKQLFIPYSRMDGHEAEFEGLGLGLAMCKTIIELHGGSIWVESQKGKGTTVRFTIPVDRDDTAKDNGGTLS